MNKVISINIGGSIFQVEENAYDKLNGYLNELKKYFSNKPEGNEIITDIENRIAELLRTKITPLKAAIDLEDVIEVTSSMGAPKDFATEEETEEKTNPDNNEEKKSATTMMNVNFPNRVFRDPDGRIIGGVCSGLGHYFKIDPIWIRLFFVIVTLTFLKAIFFGASPILVYIILWIIIPEAKTTAEKLQMRKEKINIDNIQKSVQTEFNKVKDTVQSGDFRGKATSFARRFADFIKQLIFGVLNVARHVIKAFLFLLSMVFFITAICALTGKISYDSTLGLRGMNLFHFFENNADKITTQMAIFTGFLSLGFICLLIANALLKNKFRNKTNFALRTTTLVLSVTAVILVVISSVKIASYFATSEKINNVMTLDSSQHHYYIRNIDGHANEFHHSGFAFEYSSDDTLRNHDVRIVIEASEEGTGKVIETKMSRGQNAEFARLNAAGILALTTVKDSMISLSSSFCLLNNQVYRHQELMYVIKFPIGDKFTIDERFFSHIDIESNDPEVYVQRGRTYTVTRNGIECDDCTKTYTSGTVSTSAYPMNISMEGQEFNRVKVSSAIHVKVVRGNSYLIKARGIENKHDLDIDFEDNQLSIHDNRKWKFNAMKNNLIEIIVVMPSLRGLEISGAVRAELEGFEEEEMIIDMSGSSSCNADIRAEKLIIDQSGATKLTLDGKIKSCEARVKGASKLYAARTPIKFVEINVSGASYAEVNVEEKLEADASGASNIRYKGGAKEIKLNNSGASSVEKMEK